jgi:hypothetical protein
MSPAKRLGSLVFRQIKARSSTLNHRGQPNVM